MLASVRDAGMEEGRDVQEWNPGQVLDRSVHEPPLSKAVLKQRKRDIPSTREHDCTRQEDLEPTPSNTSVQHPHSTLKGRDVRMHIKPVDIQLEPKDQVVE